MVGSGERRDRWLLLGASAVLGIALIGGSRLINGWLFGLLLLVAWALLCRGLKPFAGTRWRHVLVSVTALLFVLVLWNYSARQPRIRVEAVHLRNLPSTAQPGRVELVVQNTGAVAADVEVVSASHLGRLFRNAGELVRANLEAELGEQLETHGASAANPVITINSGQTTRVNVEVPFSERAWMFGRGEATLVVAARIRYRDRVFRREKQVCQYADPQSGEWKSCPFLNN